MFQIETYIGPEVNCVERQKKTGSTRTYNILGFEIKNQTTLIYFSIHKYNQHQKHSFTVNSPLKLPINSKLETNIKNTIHIFSL